MTDAPPIEQARCAYHASLAHLGAVERERGKLTDMRSAQRRDAVERERLRADLEEDEAVRLIDGEDAVPRKPRRDGRLAKLDRQAPAHAAAIRIQEVRVSEADGKAAQAQLPLNAAVLELAAEMQVGAIDAARDALADLALHLARLIAGDQIRNAIIGNTFAVPDDAAPIIGGLPIVRGFIAEIPPRLRPAVLSEVAVLDAANQISADIIHQIKESNP